MQNTSSIFIAVSSCLLGEHVRYDGQHKYHELIRDQLCTSLSCVPICPEVAIGLTVPRPPIQLINDGTATRAVLVDDNSIDFTESLRSHADHIYEKHPQLCGYVFKARSPSCGLLGTPILELENGHVNPGMGIFSAQIKQNFPGLPMIEEQALNSSEMVAQFISEVVNYVQNKLSMNV